MHVHQRKRLSTINMIGNGAQSNQDGRNGHRGHVVRKMGGLRTSINGS